MGVAVVGFSVQIYLVNIGGLIEICGIVELEDFFIND